MNLIRRSLAVLPGPPAPPADPPGAAEEAARAPAPPAAGLAGPDPPPAPVLPPPPPALTPPPWSVAAPPPPERDPWPWDPDPVWPPPAALRKALLCSRVPHALPRRHMARKRAIGARRPPAPAVALLADLVLVLLRSPVLVTAAYPGAGVVRGAA